jgi:L-alanine-DL-glutamate epimerase-like enolase superfamily enzyme
MGKKIGMRKVKHWSIEQLHLPLKINWKIARGSLAEKNNLVVTFKEGSFSGRGEVAFLTHGEITPAQILEYFDEFINFAPVDLNGLDHLTEILEQASDEIGLPPNLRFALEAAYVEFLSQLMEDGVSRVLGVRDVHHIQTSYSLPHMQANEVGSFLKKHNLVRFPFLKIKVIGPDDVDFVREVAKDFQGPLRLDGNEGFSSAAEALSFCQEIKDLNIEFFEQPISHQNFDECVKLREKSPFLLMADESLQDRAVVDDFQRAFHGVNVKLQKAGGYIKALRQLREARRLGLKTMLGCMIETSLGISCAMNIAYGVDFYDLDGFLHLERDPFELVYEDKGSIHLSHSQ